MPKKKVSFDIKSISPKRETTPVAPKAKSLETRITACMQYFLTGSYEKAAKAANINTALILRWKDQEWWHPTLIICKKKKQEELDTLITGCIHDGLGKLSDRISKGDAKLNRDGDIVLVPMTGKDLASSIALLFDRRALIRGEPTSRSETIGERSHLDKLQKQFEDMSQQFNAKIVEGTSEVIKVSD